MIAVDVARHHGALDVPAGPPGPPLALPSRLSRLRLLPEREVVRIPLLGVVRGQRALALLHLLGAGAHGRHQLPVVVAELLEGIDVEVHTAQAAIGHPKLFQALNILLDPAIHVGRDARHNVRPENSQRIHVVEIRVLVLSRVGIEDGVIRDSVPPLLVELGHEDIAAGIQNSISSAGRERLLHFFGECNMLSHLQRMLLLERLILERVLRRSVLAWRRRGLVFELLLAHAQRGFGSNLQLCKVHLGSLLSEVIEKLVLPRSQDDLVVDVCNVNMVLDIVAEVIRHNSAQDIEGQVRTGMAHVCDIVNSRAASVPHHLLAIQRSEGFLRTCEAVRDLQLHIMPRVRHEPRGVATSRDCLARKAFAEQIRAEGAGWCRFGSALRSGRCRSRGRRRHRHAAGGR
mmetsp:Transcript_81846/g.265117  ORF Transcript_81846/g.265117 Transcript_81846/m.265117 type:complete len:402 (-) Transcript_81846:249-1454(-)